MQLSGNIKLSLTIEGRQTSITLEGCFWRALDEMAAEHDLSVREFVAAFSASHATENLSSELRQSALAFYISRAASKAGEPCNSETTMGHDGSFTASE